MKQDKNIPIKEKVLEVLERFPFYKYAAKLNFITEETLKEWRDADKDFSDRCEASRTRGIIKYGNKSSPEFMLACAEPETFAKKDKPSEVNLNISGLVQVITHDDNRPVSVAVSGTEEPKAV